MPYDIGSVARILGNFYDPNDAPADPTTVVLELKDPDGIESTPDPVKDSVGVYHYDLPVTKAGIYYYHWTGTGAVQAASQGYVEVRKKHA